MCTKIAKEGSHTDDKLYLAKKHQDDVSVTVCSQINIKYKTNDQFWLFITGNYTFYSM